MRHKKKKKSRAVSSRVWVMGLKKRCFVCVQLRVMNANDLDEAVSCWS